jgi:hypothetical protein
MNIIQNNLQFYIDKMKNKVPFSLGMYGDGEWQCIFNQFGDNYAMNCELTEYTPALSKAMRDSLDFQGENFYFSAPDFDKIEGYKAYARLIEKIAGREYHDKQIWNEAMWKGELYPLIEEFRRHNVCIISNEMLKGLTFLDYDKFIEIGYPNCYEELDRVVAEILEYGKEGIYLFACGIPATLFVQALHGKIPNSWFLDLGSIWDGFVGIGGQRPTRRDFYLQPDTWLEWVNKNLQDIPWHREMPKVKWHGMGSLEINPNL